MDLTLLFALAAITLILIFGINLLIRPKDQNNAGNDKPRNPASRQRGTAPRRAQLARNRGIRMRANVAPQDDDASAEEDQHVTNENAVEVPDGKIGAKRRAKLEAKAEKKAQREVEEKVRAEKKKKEQSAEEERRKTEEKEKAEEKVREEEERKAKEEKEKREYEEYLKMKESFLVEEEGYEEGEHSDQQNLLQEFVNYIKQNKVVVIEDLASHFKLKTQSAIDRIKDLQKDNILTGVIDDRGKFIYVSLEEMEAVAKFINQRGRVSITELAENSNKLINLNPQTQVVK